LKDNGKEVKDMDKVYIKEKIMLKKEVDGILGYM
jgi:hypothetical protein